MTSMLVRPSWRALMTATFVEAAVLVLAQPATAVEVSVCKDQGEETCVEDGDTFVWNKERIRIENIDAPELGDPCARDMAAQSANRLAALLSSGSVEISRSEQAAGHRTRATVTVDAQDVGLELVAEGLAHKWMGSSENWCAE